MIVKIENSKFNNSNPTLTLAQYQEAMSILEAVDPDEGWGNLLRPIFIVLCNARGWFAQMGDKFVKDQPYWHAGIAFGPALSTIYSFNIQDPDVIKGGGLSFQSLNYYNKTIPEGDLQVNCLFVTNDTYKVIKDTLMYYIKNKQNAHYNYMNLVKYLFGKPDPTNAPNLNVVCSQFVDILLKSANIDISKKTSNMTKPSDLRWNGDKKYFKLYQGKVKGFKPERIYDKVDKLSSDMTNEYVTAAINKGVIDNPDEKDTNTNNKFGDKNDR